MRARMCSQSVPCRVPNRWSLDQLTGEVKRAWDLGIRCVVLFPKVSEELKTEDGAECFNENGLIPRAIRQLKQELPRDGDHDRCRARSLFLRRT